MFGTSSNGTFDDCVVCCSCVRYAVRENAKRAQQQQSVTRPHDSTAFQHSVEILFLLLLAAARCWAIHIDVRSQFSTQNTPTYYCR